MARGTLVNSTRITISRLDQLDHFLKELKERKR
jgi:hypothetical protein